MVAMLLIVSLVLLLLLVLLSDHVVIRDVVGCVAVG